MVALVGGTVLLIGIALLVLPGPGLPIVAAGPRDPCASEFLLGAEGAQERERRPRQGAAAAGSGVRGLRRRHASLS